MTIRLRRPDPDDLRPLLDAMQTAELTYGPSGVTGSTATPDGFRRTRRERALGNGGDTFEIGASVIRQWGVQRGSGLVVCGTSPQCVGDVVAIGAPLPIGWIDLACRIVAVIDEPDRAGFAYGTLPDHPECGEESFTVNRTDDGEVTFEITAVSRSRHPLSRLAPPIARLLQDRAIDRYLDAMSAAVRSGRVPD